MPQADIDEFMKSSSIGIGIACDFSYLFVGTPRMLISVDVYSNVMTRKYVVVELQTNAGYDPEAVLKAQKKKHIGEIRAKITIYLMGFISALKSNGFLWDDSQFEMLLDGTESAMLILKAESKEDEHIDLAEGAMCLRSVFQGGFINLVNKDSFTSRDVALLSRFKKAEGNLIITSARKNPTANLCFHYFELISSSLACSGKVVYFASKITEEDEGHVISGFSVLKRLQAFFKECYLITDDQINQLIANDTTCIIERSSDTLSLSCVGLLVEDTDHLLEKKIGSEVYNCVVKREPDFMYLLFSNGALIKVVVGNDAEEDFNEVHDWLARHNLVIPASAFQRYLQKGDFAMPLFFRRG